MFFNHRNGGKRFPINVHIKVFLCIINISYYNQKHTLCHFSSTLSFFFHYSLYATWSVMFVIVILLLFSVIKCIW